MKLILASNSPRRKELLDRFGFKFKTITSDYAEKETGLSPADTVKTFATGKAENVFDALKDKSDAVVLGADTVVVMEGKILGKPADKTDAVKTLKLLSGKTHSVLTGYAIISDKKREIGYSETKVTFNLLSDELITDYVNSGLPLDKAGSYGIQDGYDLVKSYDGGFYNVMGLPIDIIEPRLKDFLK